MESNGFYNGCGGVEVVREYEIRIYILHTQKICKVFKEKKEINVLEFGK